MGRHAVCVHECVQSLPSLRVAGAGESAHTEGGSEHRAGADRPRPARSEGRRTMAGTTPSPMSTAAEYQAGWSLPRRPGARGAAAALAVALLVSAGALAILAQRQAATIAAQAAVIRQQADVVGRHERTNEALLRTAQQYAARLLVLSEVAELDRAIIEATGQVQDQRAATERALQAGAPLHAEAVMVEQLLQRRLIDLQAQRQLALAR